MVAPSVTYTFSNSTTADATQVNSNFTDIINSLTDGLKDLSILTLSVAGTVNLNGNVNLGNAAGDAVTVLGTATFTPQSIFSAGLQTDTISEKTAAAGVTIDSMPIKDGGILGATGDIYNTAWTDYGETSTIVGWSSFTAQKIYYKKIGKLVFINFDLEGTSNSTSITFTLPFTLSASGQYVGGALMGTRDNGTDKTTPGRFYVSAGNSIVNVFSDAASAAWTASGTKQIHGQFWFEVA